ncbi:MAG TPA: hypothetical protein VFZ89_13675 [Solirubrobacteraceae bacterium]
MVVLKDQNYVIEHPNREKAASKTTKAVVVLLLLISAGLIAIITVGGWDVLAGAKAVSLAFVAIYVVMAFYVGRWNAGVLPVAAAVAIIVVIFAGVAVPGWFDRDKTGFSDPSLSAEMLGLLTVLVIPVQVLLIIATLQGVAQKWSVEVERYPDETPSGASPAAA